MNPIGKESPDLKKLAQWRDELRLKAHLLDAELRKQWNNLEIDDHHSFSHRVQGLTVNDALAQLEWKLGQERVGLKPVTIERISGKRPAA